MNRCCCMCVSDTFTSDNNVSLALSKATEISSFLKLTNNTSFFILLAPRSQYKCCFTVTWRSRTSWNQPTETEAGELFPTSLYSELCCSVASYLSRRELITFRGGACVGCGNCSMCAHDVRMHVSVAQNVCTRTPVVQMRENETPKASESPHDGQPSS